MEAELAEAAAVAAPAMSGAELGRIFAFSDAACGGPQHLYEPIHNVYE